MLIICYYVQLYNSIVAAVCIETLLSGLLLLVGYFSEHVQRIKVVVQKLKERQSFASTHVVQPNRLSLLVFSYINGKDSHVKHNYNKTVWIIPRQTTPLVRLLKAIKSATFLYWSMNAFRFFSITDNLLMKNKLTTLAVMTVNCLVMYCLRTSLAICCGSMLKRRHYSLPKMNCRPSINRLSNSTNDVKTRHNMKMQRNPDTNRLTESGQGACAPIWNFQVFDGNRRVCFLTTDCITAIKSIIVTETELTRCVLLLNRGAWKWIEQ